MNEITMGAKRFPQIESGAVTRVTNQTEVIRITFTNEGIGGSADHLEELDAIRSAQEGDTIALYFSGCPGGDLNTGFAIMNAIMATSARTIAVIEGHNASLATIIPMVCDEVIVTPFASFMIHTANTGAWGTVGNVERQGLFFSKEIQRFMRELYDGFVTEEEMVKLLDGSELYLNDTDIQERLTKRAEKLVTDLEQTLADIEKDEAAVVDVVDVKPKRSPARKTTKTPKK